MKILDKPNCTECLLGAPAHEQWHEVPELTEEEIEKGRKQLTDLAKKIKRQGGTE